MNRDALGKNANNRLKYAMAIMCELKPIKDVPSTEDMVKVLSTMYFYKRIDYMEKYYAENGFPEDLVAYLNIQRRPPRTREEMDKYRTEKRKKEQLELYKKKVALEYKYLQREVEKFIQR